MSDLGSNFKILNITNEDLKKSVVGAKDAAAAEAKAAKGAPSTSIEMVR